MPKSNHINRLTLAQQNFVRYMLLGMKQKEAAIKAGYSARTADSIASQVLRLPKVQAIMLSYQERLQTKTEVTAEWVKKELLRQYIEMGVRNRADVSELYDTDGTLKPLEDWPREWREKQMVKGLDTKELFNIVKMPNGIKEKVLVGYLKKVMLTDHKQAELNTLRNIGELNSVKAFERGVGNVNVPIQLNVVYADEKKSLEVPASSNGHGNVVQLNIKEADE